jgi:predicted ABC-type transport system involved in lysophospholipase L1 biosynthesis ATPase subunit
MTGLASCRSVTVTHGRGRAQVTALAHVSVRIDAGERLALFGASGSGKTTLLHVLGGLVTPDSGEVLWRSEPLASLAAPGRARPGGGDIAYVFQSSNLLPTFTAYENVAFAARAAASENGDPGADATGLLALVGLRGKLDALPAELSGGEAQRVAIARALAQRPALLLCDEPTGHLDSDTGGRVLDLIDALHAELGFAQVVATHDPDVAARADRAVGLDGGHVVSDGELS